MNVLMATPYALPEGGGLERYAHKMASHLVADGHRVTQLAFADWAYDDVLDGVRRIRVRPAWRVSNTPVGPWAMHREARRLLIETQPDVVHVHTPVPGAAEPAAWAAWRAGIPYVVTYHAGLLMGGNAPLDAMAWLHRATLTRWLLKGASARVAVSPAVAELALAGHASTVVPPGVDDVVAAGMWKGDVGRILYVGPVSRAYAWKGFQTLFDAFQTLARRHASVRLDVVGTGDLVEHYMRRARSLGSADRMTFLGQLDDEALRDTYRRAQMLVLPSLTAAESFGMVLAEANAHGRPVVASDVGGIPSFVSHEENGLLVPPGDADALAGAMLRLVDDPAFATRLGKSGAERVRREHRWDDIARRMAEVYAQVLTSGSVTGPRVKRLPHRA